MNMRLVLEYENLTYVTINPLLVDINPDSTLEEWETFDRWKNDNLKVKSYILGSMVLDLLRQYIEVPDASNIMRTLKELFESNREIEIYQSYKDFSTIRSMMEKRSAFMFWTW